MQTSESESKNSTSANHASRRGFIKAAGLTGSAIMVAPYFVPAHVLGGSRSGSPNDRIRVGAIGTSIYVNRYTGGGNHPGRGALVGHQAGVLGDMVAVADVNRHNAEFFAERYKNNCKIYNDYQELISRDDIDAVTIGTPDHWHAKIAIDSMRAGKHVYCEKPLSLTIREGQQICKVAKETGKVFQVGTQQRSEFEQVFLKAVAIAQSGLLGDKLHCLIGIGKGEKGGPFVNKPKPDHIDWNRWLGQAPEVPYCPERGDFDYRWWLEYGGGQVTDWGAHHGDIALWALGMSNSGPTSIEGKGMFGKVDNGFNSAFEFDCNFEFPDGHTAKLSSGNNELIISGDKGRIRVNRGGLTGKPAEELGVAHKISKNDWGNDAAPKDGPKGGDGPQWLQAAIDKLYHGKKPGNHMGNFFDCIRDGGTPVSDVVSQHRSASFCHLANIAMRLERKLHWDPKKETFANDDEANSMVSRQQREGYRIDVDV